MSSVHTIRPSGATKSGVIAFVTISMADDRVENAFCSSSGDADNFVLRDLK